MTDLVRFDRMLLESLGRAAVPAISQREPVRARASRFVGRATCPMCGTGGEGIEYHGELMSGAKVHTIVAHTAGMRRVANGQPRCLGSGMRMTFVSGSWIGVPLP